MNREYVKDLIQKSWLLLYGFSVTLSVEDIPGQYFGVLSKFKLLSTRISKNIDFYILLKIW